MSEDLRVLDFEGVIDVIDQLTTEVHDEPHYWIAGTLAPTRSWEDLIEVADGMVGLSNLTAPRPEDDEWDPYEELPDRLMAEVPVEAEDGAKRYGDWRYPAWAFVDEGTTEDLERADAQLAGLAAFPEDVVRTEDHRVLSPAQLIDRVESIHAHYGDERIVMTGMFSPPGGNFSISDEESVHRVGMTTYPADIFAETGIGPISSAKTLFGGAVILRRDDVSEEVLRVVDGEAEEVGPDV